MSAQLRYVARQLRSDDIAVARVWRDDMRRRFALHFFDPGICAIQNYLSAYEQLAESLERAEIAACGD